MNLSDKSINEILFVYVVPHLRDWLMPLPPTLIMKELQQFQQKLECCSEEQQLLIISQITITNFSIINEPDEIQQVHNCISNSIFLRDWRSEIQEMESWWTTQNRYNYYAFRLYTCFQQLSSDKIGNLMITLVQLSSPIIVQEMKIIYGSLSHNTFYVYQDLIQETSPILQVEEKNYLILELQNSSLIVQRILLLHWQLEINMLLHLQQMKYQLNMQIIMEMDMEILIQWQTHYH